jgi:hypothetical protein
MKRATFFLYLLVLGVAYLIDPGASPRAAGSTVEGRIFDGSTGQPLAGAEVKIQASMTERATSKDDGSFRIDTDRVPGEAVVITAGAPDQTKTGPAFYNGRASALVGDTNVEISLVPVVLTDDMNYEFSTPQDCSLCHSLKFQEYQDTGHRNAAKNTWVKDLYDGSGTPGTGANGFTFKGAHPELAGDCAECHAPMEAAKHPPDTTEFNQVTGSAYEWGVSCDVCHKTIGIIHPDLPGTMGMLFARGSRETQFGPLSDSSPNFPNVMRSAYNPLHSSALLCAACHEDNNDHDFDGDYLDEGSVPSEATYSEWLESPYAVPGPEFESCQDCHMQPKGDNTACQQYQSIVRDPSQIHSHDFEGTTNEYLQNAATLRLVARREGGQLVLDAAVTNDRTGHHVPSGVTVRNMILLVTATDAGGSSLTFVPEASSTVPEWGGVGDPAQGYYAGLPGKGFTKILSDGVNDFVFFTEARTVKSDNRIPAGVTDWSTYVYQLPDGFAPVRVTGRLIYRRAFRATVDLKGWTLTGHGLPNPDLQPPYFGVLMSEAALDVPLPGPAVDASRVRYDEGLRLRLTGGTFPAGTAVEVSDGTGAWYPFSKAAAISASGQKLTQKGKVNGVGLRAFWPDGAIRHLRITAPDGGATVLRLLRSGSRYIPVV